MTWMKGGSSFFSFFLFFFGGETRGSATARRNKCLGLHWEESYCLWQDKFSQAQRGAAAATESSCLTSATVKGFLFPLSLAPPQKAKCASWGRFGQDMTGGPQGWGGLLSHLALQDATNKSRRWSAIKPTLSGRRNVRDWIYIFIAVVLLNFTHTRRWETNKAAHHSDPGDWFGLIKEWRKK